MISLLVACIDAFPEADPDPGWRDHDYDQDGFTEDDGDCDDLVRDVAPNSEESCNGLDDDCNEQIDEDAIDRSGWFFDDDGDGLGDPTRSTLACEAPSGSVENARDCDDTDAAVGAPETYYGDGDGDGYGASKATTKFFSAESCYDLSSFLVTNTDDCDDEDPAINPGTTWYADLDLDTFGDFFIRTQACDPGAGWVLDARDCDDEDPDIEVECAWRSISMADYVGCAVRGNGQPLCWGDTFSGVLDPPDGAQLLTVDVPDRPNTWAQAVCGVNENRRITCWGDDRIVREAPVGEGFVSVSVGVLHACALDGAGLISCWGTDLEGSISEAPTDSGYQQVVAAENLSLAIDAAGHIVAWGNGSTFPPFTETGADLPEACAGGGFLTGECDLAIIDSTLGALELRQVAAEALRVCGLTFAGDIVCAGTDDSVDRGGSRSLQGPFESMAVGRSRTCGVDALGGLSCAGTSNSVASDLAQDEGYTEFATSTAGLADCATWSDEASQRHEIHCWGEDDRDVATPPSEYW